MPLWQLARVQRRLAQQLGRCTTRFCSQSASAGVPYETTLKSDDAAGPSSVPSEADVVVIGGGSVGCNTLYHLTKLGVSNAVLLEKAQLTAGTTWHTAGLVWRLRPNDVEMEILNYTRDLIQDVLGKETGLDTGWINNGGIFIASNKERLDEYQRMMTLGRNYDIESYVLSPEETKKIYPLMNVSDMYGALYSPGDGTIDPAGFCTTLTRAAKKGGAQVVENCSVTGIQVKEDDYGTKRVVGVETSHGIIKTKAVVNCAGVWSPYIGQMAGVAVPLIAMHHAYVVTERIEGIQNMPNIRDHDASVYLKLQGDALSCGGYEPNPVFWDKVDKDFAFSLFELDWDVFSVHVEGCVNRVPVIERTGIKSTVCGPESFTADHKPLMGEAPEMRGFYLGCGFNSSGMMMGGGCGRELARWVVNGRPTLDMYGYDIRRFPTCQTSDNRWTRERSHEAYAKNYSIVFPHDEPLAARNSRTDPFHEVLLEAGCVFQERHGWERPGYFTPQGPTPIPDYDYYGAYEELPANEVNLYNDRLRDDYTFDFPKHHDVIGKECVACRERAAVFNMSYFGKYYLTGPDAQKAADWIFSNNVDKPPGSTVYTCMLDKSGGIESDLTVSMISPGEGSAMDPTFDGKGFYIAVGGGAAQHNWSHITDILQDNRLNCQMSDMSEEMGMLSIQGPRSRDIVQALTDTDMGNEAFPFSTNQVISVAGHRVRALRLSFVGELGWELHIPKESCVPVYKAVMEEGAKHGAVNSGYRAIDSLSIEKGYRHWHADIRPDDTPFEAGLVFTCKLKSNTPFLGREALEKLKPQGLKKKLVCFTIDDHVPLLGLEAVWRDGIVVGYLRRADYAFSLGKSIGYGYVRNPEGGKVTADFLKAGEYSIERMGVVYPATIHLKTPFDPKNDRVKGIYNDNGNAKVASL
ncbi:sarcosine dehydrogenase, mitochondrial-like [Branchiostoma lanceolatum]|uniref:sarcosine dehydrogenase, mitochondrial-like n=1 Tax=Branchiostoma lanceolatum TaxID=7740 RepID=UPI00345679C2